MDSKERRRGMRVPVKMWVEEQSENSLYFQRSANLSTGGIYLENTIPHDVGTVVNLLFTLPGDSEPLRVRGEIVAPHHEANDLGMGVRFVELTPELAARLERFVREQGG
jgi:uncharacterized protein (TIGR02266 family)